MYNIRYQKNLSPVDKKLYEVFASKELSNGCVISHKDFYDKKIMFFEPNRLQRQIPGEYRCQIIDLYIQGHVSSVYGDKKETLLQNYGYTIVGHDPTIESVYIIGKEKKVTVIIPDLYDRTLVLLEQSDDVKNALIDLFTNSK